MRLIDADKLDTRERGNNSQRAMWWNIKYIINNAPTIEAKPVVHAHWTEENTDCWHCSDCLHPVLLNGAEEYVFSNYCPFCGALMDEAVSG